MLRQFVLYNLRICDILVTGALIVSVLCIFEYHFLVFIYIRSWLSYNLGYTLVVSDYVVCGFVSLCGIQISQFGVCNKGIKYSNYCRFQHFICNFVPIITVGAYPALEFHLSHNTF